MKFEQIETGLYRAHSAGIVYTIVRANRDLWTLDLSAGGRADVARVTSDTKSSLRKWAQVYDANPYSERWPDLTRVARTQVLMIELDPNLGVRDTGWVSGPATPHQHADWEVQ